nr:hypothetical protein [Tanacetum cinerariifolium]
MSSASSAATYTSVDTDSEPGRPVAPPSPDYILGLEEPQIPPAPQDEDERELMFIQPHDPDYVPKPMYPEYIPLEDEHVLPPEEQPLPPVDLPTAESPGYVAESDPKEDTEECEDDETKDGPIDYPMDGGDDGDDDDGDSSGDDADDEEEDEEDEEEEQEEHLAPADSATGIPTVKLVSPHRGTEPVIPPPFTNTTTIRARITVQLQSAICLPPEAEVERLLAMPTPPPSPLTSLSPPSAGEPWLGARPHLHCPSPPPVPSPLLPSSGYPTQIQTLRMASTQALIDAVTTALPSPLLPPLPPPLYIPPPVDRRDDVLETEMPPRKGLCLSTLGSKYKIRENSTEAVPEIAHMTLGEVNTRVTELAELHKYDTHDLYALLEDAQDSRTHISQRVTIDSRQAHMIETLRVMGDMRREMGDMQAELLALREQPRRARQPGSDARVPDHQDAPRDTDNHI